MAKTFKTILDEIKQDFSGIITDKVNLIKLSALEKGVPAAVRAGYMTVLGIIAVHMLLSLFITAGMAMALIFVDPVTDAFLTIRGLTFGFLCLAGIFLLIDVILFLLSDSICTSIQTSIINGQLDAMDEEERRASEATRFATASSDTVIVTDDSVEVKSVNPKTMNEETL